MEEKKEIHVFYKGIGTKWKADNLIIEYSQSWLLLKADRVLKCDKFQCPDPKGYFQLTFNIQPLKYVNFKYPTTKNVLFQHSKYCCRERKNFVFWFGA